LNASRSSSVIAVSILPTTHCLITLGWFEAIWSFNDIVITASSAGGVVVDLFSGISNFEGGLSVKNGLITIHTGATLVLGPLSCMVCLPGQSAYSQEKCVQAQRVAELGKSSSSVTATNITNSNLVNVWDDNAGTSASISTLTSNESGYIDFNYPNNQFSAIGVVEMVLSGGFFLSTASDRIFYARLFGVSGGTINALTGYIPLNQSNVSPTSDIIQFVVDRNSISTGYEDYRIYFSSGTLSSSGVLTSLTATLSQTVSISEINIYNSDCKKQRLNMVDGDINTVNIRPGGRLIVLGNVLNNMQNENLRVDGSFLVLGNYATSQGSTNLVGSGDIYTGGSLSSQGSSSVFSSTVDCTNNCQGTSLSVCPGISASTAPAGVIAPTCASVSGESTISGVTIGTNWTWQWQYLDNTNTWSSVTSTEVSGTVSGTYTNVNSTTLTATAASIMKNLLTTTRYLRVVWTSNTGCSGGISSQTVYTPAIAVLPASSFPNLWQWVGGTAARERNWNTSTNWCATSNSIPSLLSDVLITKSPNDVYPLIDASAASAKSVTITADVSAANTIIQSRRVALQIPSGVTLTIYGGDLDNNAVIPSNDSQAAGILNFGTIKWSQATAGTNAFFNNKLFANAGTVEIDGGIANTSGAIPNLSLNNYGTFRNYDGATPGLIKLYGDLNNYSGASFLNDLSGSQVAIAGNFRNSGTFTGWKSGGIGTLRFQPTSTDAQTSSSG